MHLVIWHNGYVRDFVQRMPPQARKRCHSDHYKQMHAQPERRKLLTEFLVIEKKKWNLHGLACFCLTKKENMYFTSTYYTLYKNSSQYLEILL
jgi:hypothetical protein